MTSEDTLTVDDAYLPQYGQLAPTSAPKRSRGKGWMIGGGAAVILLGLGTAGAIALVSGASTTVHGSVTVSFVDLAGDGENTGDACIDSSSNGYGDLAPGAQVSVTDDKGATVGIGELGPGKRGTNFLAQTCTYEFAVQGIPTGKPFYGVHVGNQSRGVYQLKGSDVAKPVRLQVGD